MAELHGITLRELFVGTEELPSITIGTLAKSLNVPVAKLVPLVKEGYLLAMSSGDITAASYVEGISVDAVNWLRHWFMPARNKPLFNLEDVAELINANGRKVMKLAASEGLPVMFDPAFGHMFSAMTVKKLMMLKEGKRQRGANRFDRQALLWRIMEGDPEQAVKMPSFKQSMEDEIERIGSLDEPARGIRSRALLASMREVKTIVDSGGDGGDDGGLDSSALSEAIVELQKV